MTTFNLNIAHQLRLPRMVAMAIVLWVCGAGESVQAKVVDHALAVHDRFEGAPSGHGLYREGVSRFLAQDDTPPADGLVSPSDTMPDLSETKKSTAQTEADSGEQPSSDAQPPEAAVPPASGRSTSNPDGVQTTLTDAQRIRRARNLFEYGDCQSVIDVLENFEELSVQKETDNLVDAHRMLGVCYHQLDRKAEALGELRKILYLKPKYELDPFLTPPPVVELFEQLRIEMQSKLEEIDAAQDDSTLDNGNMRVQIIERGSSVQVTPWAVVLLPFGIAQWVNGSPVKAAIFGVLQGTLLTMNVSTFWAGYLLAPDNRVTSSDQAIMHGVLWWAHIGALFLGGLAYGAGVADAWWNWEQSVEISVRESNVTVPSTDDSDS